jgi:hypothetical protein
MDDVKDNANRTDFMSGRRVSRKESRFWLETAALHAPWDTYSQRSFFAAHGTRLDSYPSTVRVIWYSGSCIYTQILHGEKTALHRTLNREFVAFTCLFYCRERFDRPPQA